MNDADVPDVSPDLPSAQWRLTLSLLQRLPQAALSRSFGRLADVRLPRAVRATVLGTFARAVGIDVTEAERPLTDYASLNRFFVRRLRPGVRRWPDEPTEAASPVDGVIGRFGQIRNDTLVQAKGREYTATALLADAGESRAFEGGSFLTIYLSPRHYHRIHAPISGAIGAARHVPGALFPVNAPAVMHVDALFPRNERLVCTIDGAFGRVAVAAIGAYNVGRISAAFDEQWNGGPLGWVTNRSAVGEADARRYTPALPIERGEEIMAFHLGSTVVLLFDRQYRLRETLEAGADVQLGAPIASFQGVQSSSTTR